MSQITEQKNEESLLSWLGNTLNWQVYGGREDPASGGPLINDEYDRDTSDAILWSEVRERVIALNPHVTEANVRSVTQDIKAEISLSGTQSLVESNKSAHTILTAGIETRIESDTGEMKSRSVTLIDFDDTSQNSFIAANQVTFAPDTRNIRPDVTLFVNGFPIVQVELKSTGQGSSVNNAISDMSQYESTVPEAFRTVLFNVGAGTLTYRVGGVGAPHKHYRPWSHAPPQYATEDGIDEFKQGALSTLNRSTLLNILENYVFYAATSGGVSKIVPRHMQYYATKKLVSRIENGSNSDTNTRGLIWHTQGSGKTYTMLYTANRLLQADWFSAPQIVILVDTDELREQLQSTLQSIGFDSKSTIADSQTHLYELLTNGGSGIVVTTVQMFQDAPTDQSLQTNPQTVVLTDEAHRYMEKLLGNRLEKALPDAHHYGFTGTPVSEDVRNTFRNYSNGAADTSGTAYLHKYSMSDGQEDGVILPVHFEVREDIQWNIEDKRLDKRFEKLTEGLSTKERKQVIGKFSSRELGDLGPRVEAIAKDIHEHFTSKVDQGEWKGIVVTTSRSAAVKYGKFLSSVFEEDSNGSYNGADAVKVIISQDNDDELGDSKAVVDERQHSRVRDEFEEEPLPKVLVVCNKLLTGFDAPRLKVMYMDKGMKNHKLQQAIARVNRPDTRKYNGLVVDYRGALANVEESLQYSDEVIVTREEELIEPFTELIEECNEFFESDISTIEIEGQEDVKDLVSTVIKRSREYREKVGRLQNIYESLSPHEILVDYESEYKLLNQVRLELRGYEEGADSVSDITSGDEWGDKTRSLLSDSDTVEFGIEEEDRSIELSSRTIEEISGEFEVVRREGELEELLGDNIQSNPQYEQLSERVDDILDDWRQDLTDASETLESLDEVEEQLDDIQNNDEDSGLGDAEYALYLLIQNEYKDTVTDDEKAKLLAKEIEIRFQEKVNRSFSGWKSDSQTQDEMKDAIFQALTELQVFSLYDDEEFFRQCIQYLVENH